MRVVWVDVSWPSVHRYHRIRGLMNMINSVTFLLDVGVEVDRWVWNGLPTIAITHLSVNRNTQHYRICSLWRLNVQNEHGNFLIKCFKKYFPNWLLINVFPGGVARKIFLGTERIKVRPNVRSLEKKVETFIMPHCGVHLNA